MRLLLDTHTLLWWHAQTASLSEAAREAVEDPDNDVFLSVVSAWEMQIKLQLGKLPLPGTVSELVEEEMQTNGFQPLLVHFDLCTSITFTRLERSLLTTRTPSTVCWSHRRSTKI